MTGAISVLLLCQLIGETAVRLANLPIPGPLVGMALLFFVLVTREKFNNASNQPMDALDQTSNVILANLSLLFVPAAVGVMQHLPVLQNHGLALGVAIVGSTVLTLLVSVGVFRLMSSGVQDAE